MIIIRIGEGLGNQMFQYAYARALGIHMQLPVKMDISSYPAEKYIQKAYERPYGLKNFRIALKPTSTEFLYHWSYLRNQSYFDKIIKYFANKKLYYYKYYYESSFNYCPSKLAIEDNTYLIGWFQNEKYFKDVRQLLLKEFRPRKKIKLPSFLLNIIQNNTTVSIHIRRGDYVTDKSARKYIGLCGIDYYINAMQYIEKNIDNPHYLVFSDDIQWVKKHLCFSAPHIYVADVVPLEDYEELLLMSRCKHNIIANSTFSWWGAWLNQNENKKVVAPQKWFRYRERENIAPESWILI